MRKVRPALLKGFDQEFLPPEQLQFNALVELIRRNFERFGFLPIETPSAERIEVLTSKGGAEKEIYALSRLAADEDDEAARGALRFDLTVPLARYVAMRERELAFPFRRYQIQRVWRGENPQVKRGRFREFYQCDIDVINRETLSYLAEAEIPSVIYSVFREMAIGEFVIRINNRKVLKGILQHFDVSPDTATPVLRALDKIEKEDEAAILGELERHGMRAARARELYGVVATRRKTNETLALLAELGYRNEMYAAGVDELGKMVQAIREFGVPDAAFAIDLRVVRGLVARLKEANLLRPLARTPAEVLVTTLAPEALGRYLQIAAGLRSHDVNTEVYLERAKIGKQFEYASKKGFRIAITAGPDEFARGTVKIKNLATQLESDVPAGEIIPRVKSMLDTKAH